MSEVVYMDDALVDSNIELVETTLGECQSWYTKKNLAELKAKRAAGKHIEKCEMEKLMFWYAKDCEFKSRNAFPCQKEPVNVSG